MQCKPIVTILIVSIPVMRSHKVCVCSYWPYVLLNQISLNMFVFLIHLFRSVVGNGSIAIIVLFQLLFHFSPFIFNLFSFFVGFQMVYDVFVFHQLVTIGAPLAAISAVTAIQYVRQELVVWYPLDLIYDFIFVFLPEKFCVKSWFWDIYFYCCWF